MLKKIIWSILFFKMLSWATVIDKTEEIQYQIGSEKFIKIKRIVENGDALLETLGGYVLYQKPGEYGLFFAELNSNNKIVASTTACLETDCAPPVSLLKHLREPVEVGVAEFLGGPPAVDGCLPWFEGCSKDPNNSVNGTYPNGFKNDEDFRRLSGEINVLVIPFRFTSDGLELPTTNDFFTHSQMNQALNGNGFVDELVVGSTTLVSANEKMTAQEYWKRESGGSLVVNHIVANQVSLNQSMKHYHNLIESKALDRYDFYRDLLKLVDFSSIDMSSLTKTDDGKIVTIMFYYQGSPGLPSDAEEKGWLGTSSAFWPKVSYSDFSVNINNSSYVFENVLQTRQTQDFDINTFIHEEGHALLSFPDLYHVEADSLYQGIVNNNLYGYETMLSNDYQLNPLFRLMNDWNNDVAEINYRDFGKRIFLNHNEIGLFYYNENEFFALDVLDSLEETSYSLSQYNPNLANQIEGGYVNKIDNTIGVYHVDKNAKYIRQYGLNSIDKHYVVSFETSLLPKSYDQYYPVGTVLRESDVFDLNLKKDNVSARWWDGNYTGMKVYDIRQETSGLSFLFGDESYSWGAKVSDALGFSGSWVDENEQFSEELVNGKNLVSSEWMNPSNKESKHLTLSLDNAVVRAKFDIKLESRQYISHGSSQDTQPELRIYADGVLLKTIVAENEWIAVDMKIPFATETLEWELFNPDFSGILGYIGSFERRMLLDNINVEYFNIVPTILTPLLLN